jgi:hypothetical protein
MTSAVLQLTSTIIMSECVDLEIGLGAGSIEVWKGQPFTVMSRQFLSR